jgi:DNA polymerase I-like protein with 3'-5' exonuclease and polymerase domains
MTKPRIVYVYSSENDYMQPDYIELFKTSNAELRKGDVETFKLFTESCPIQQLDTETNVTERHTDRELYVVQLGNFGGTEQHIFDIEDLDEVMKTMLHDLFSSETTFIAHNAKFEYMILFKYFGVSIRKFQDTMLASRLITAGLDLPSGYNGLSNLVMTAFGVDLSKAAQTTFDGLKMTPEQLLYADMDVIYLGKLLDRLKRVLTKWNLMTCFQLENSALRPIGDMSINGIRVNQAALAENVTDFELAAETSKAEIVAAFKAETNPAIIAKLETMNVIQKNTEVKINWGSSAQKKAVLRILYPNVEILSTAKAGLVKLAAKIPSPGVLNKIISGDTETVEMFLVSRYEKELYDMGLLVRKGDLNINFNSPSQLLEFFKIWHPHITSVGVKVLKPLKSPVVQAYKKYTKASKLVSSFGRKMYDYIEDDGRIHAGFNQLVPTGSRMSSSSPNMQQAPSTEQYRRIFVPEPGWELVDSDYASAELFIAAFLANDKKLIEAIELGYDLHSYSAYQIFGEEWINAGGSREPVGKPPTEETAIMRKKSKALSFSLLYGTGVVSFSENSGIKTSEGKLLMDKYYATFPELSAFFKDSGEFALKNNYIREPHFKRVRFFNAATNGKEASHIRNAAMNYQPQSINGSIMKYALCLMKKYIDENSLQDRVRLLITVHDQQLSEARKDFSAEWAIIQTELMEKAAKFVIPSGVLKVDTDILQHWTKG